MSNSSDWLQYFEQNPINSHTPISSNLTILPTTTPSTTPTYQSNPNKGSVSTKPIRRRSRASKKTPTTLLNANANNFRALVQQFTGCQSKYDSFSSRQGPITLNFQKGSVQKNDSIGTTKIDPFGNTNYTYNQQGQQQYSYDRQEEEEEGKCMVSSSSTSTIFDDLVIPNPYSYRSSEDNESAITNMEIPACEHFIQDFSLHELARDSVSCEDINDAYF